MKPILTFRLVFIIVASVFGSAVFGNNVAQAAEKTITAHIEIDSQLGTTKIEDNADADARVVIDGLEDDPPIKMPQARSSLIRGVLLLLDCRQRFLM